MKGNVREHGATRPESRFDRQGIESIEGAPWLSPQLRTAGQPAMRETLK
jgi:hypothetical protein